MVKTQPWQRFSFGRPSRDGKGLLEQVTKQTASTPGPGNVSSVVVIEKKEKEPCVYFNHREGCKRGAYCLHMHSATHLERFLPAQDRKRRLALAETWRPQVDQIDDI